MATEALTRGELPRVQWAPVIAGVLCALATHIVLGLFGVAFGFAAEPSGRGVGVLAAIWGLATPLVASFIGAWVAVRIAADREERGAMLHGALVWCIGLVAGAVFITGSLASGAMTAGMAASGNVGLRTIERRDTPGSRARASATADDAAKGAGGAGVAALLGLGGALLGAATARRAVTGEGRGRSRRRHARDEVQRRADVAREFPTATGVAYGDRTTGSVATRPTGEGSTEDPTLHH
jgi:hypothetical protein